jgi:hypothetical protein
MRQALPQCLTKAGMEISFVVRISSGHLAHERLTPGGQVETRTTPKIMTAYYSSDGTEWADEYAEITPAAGQFIWRGTGKGYQAYQIAEVWSVQEKHGGITHGLTVFLDPVDVMDTRLGKHAPKYYGSEDAQ